MQRKKEKGIYGRTAGKKEIIELEKRRKTERRNKGQKRQMIRKEEI
jgi:hypothetical protein